MPFPQKTVKAGVLLHALLILSLFSLLLQFYVQRQISHAHISLSTQKSTLATAMAELTAQEAQLTTAPTEADLTFDTGKSHYKKEDSSCQISVTLTSGESYSYSISLSSKTP